MTRLTFSIFLWISILLLVVVIPSAAAAEASITATKAKAKTSPNNIEDQDPSPPSDPVVGHLIPHSHCDAAYKKTVDEYYETEVRYILDNIVRALKKSNTTSTNSTANKDANSRRRFVWAETVFLSMWWKDPRTTKQQDFRALLENGQLEIANGGWVMHDEAITRYDSQILQMTKGHDKLQRMLGFVPEIRTGWQIDPFGASQQQVNLHDWSHMPFLVHNRIPQYLKDDLMDNRSLEFLWHAPSGAQILVHVLDHHYESPVGFDWENLVHVAEEITHENVQDKADELMSIIQDRSKYFTTPNVMIPFGGDFRFVNATRQFKNMDRIVDYVQEHPERYQGATLRYSTPQEYYEALFDNYLSKLKKTKNEKKHSLSTSRGLPTVTDSPFLSYWTGYYTQLPILKQMVRACEVLLRTVTMNQWMVQRTKSFALLQYARETVGLMQHHDAITSTSYRFVLQDYMKRLQRTFDGLTQVLTELVVNTTFSSDHAINSSDTGATRGNIIGGGPYFHETVLVRGAQTARTVDVERIVNPQMGLEGISILVLNSLDWEVETLVSFVSTRPDVAVIEHMGVNYNRSITAQATPLEQELESPELGLFLISFPVKLPRFGKRRYSVHVCRRTWATDQDSHNPPSPPGMTCAIPAKTVSEEEAVSRGLSSNAIQVDFDQNTNDLSRLSLLGADKSPLATLEISHDIILYNGTNDTIYDMRTGVAYSDPQPLLGNQRRRVVESYQGVFFSQVTLELTSWLKVRYRVMNYTSEALPSLSEVTLESLLEVSMLAGPIPPLVNVASRFNTNLGPRTEWFYDENGFLPTAGSWNKSLGVGYNMRPLVSRSWLVQSLGESDISDDNIKVLTAYSVDPRGVASRGDGALDVVWKRRNHRTGTEDTGDDDWWKEGEDYSTSRSSVWLGFNLFDAQHTSNADSFRNLPLSHRKLSLELANDFVALQLPRDAKAKEAMTTYSVFATTLQLLLRKVHLIDVKLEKENFPNKSDDNIWVDMHIENLSDDPAYTTEIPVASLLPQHMIERLLKTELRSLTFLYPYKEDFEKALVSEGEDSTCELVEGTSDTGGDLLSIRSRGMCSVRFILSASNTPNDTARRPYVFANIRRQTWIVLSLLGVLVLLVIYYAGTVSEKLGLEGFRGRYEKVTSEANV